MEKIAMLAIPVLAAMLHASSAAVSSEDQRQIVRLHNKFRSQVRPPAKNMQKMYWDDTIADMAQRYAESCPRGHNTQEDRNVQEYNVQVGQNLAWGYPSWAAALRAWHGEVRLFRFGVEPESYLGPGGFGKIGHYTQMVRDRAVRIGCGYAHCGGGGGATYVCNYALGNSHKAELPYDVGSRCAACRGRCSNNLCDCGGKLCYNGGTLDLETCTCQCDDLYKGDHCEKLSCPRADPRHCGRAAPGGFPRDFCSRYTNVPTDCPHMCGICDGSSSNSGGSAGGSSGSSDSEGQGQPPSDCPAVDPWPCGVQWFPEYCDRYNNVPGTCRIMCGECPARCPGKDFSWCRNEGVLDPDSCACRCGAGWTGERCHIHAVCPVRRDASHCRGWAPHATSYCEEYTNVPVECPYMCGRCV